MWVGSAADGGVDVFLGDAGGFPADPPSHGSTLDEALFEAETNASKLLQETQRLQQQLLTQDTPELQHEEFIRVAGWPLIRNPHYRK